MNNKHGDLITTHTRQQVLWTSVYIYFTLVCRIQSTLEHWNQLNLIVSSEISKHNIDKRSFECICLVKEVTLIPASCPLPCLPPVQDIAVCRTVTPSAAMGIIAPRDFVDVILIKRYEDGSISSNGALTLILVSSITVTVCLVHDKIPWAREELPDCFSMQEGIRSKAVGRSCSLTYKHVQAYKKH